MEIAWYCTVDPLVMTVKVVVINESTDSKEQIRADLLRLGVNVLIFYRFLESFYPDIVFLCDRGCPYSPSSQDIQRRRQPISCS